MCSKIREPDGRGGSTERVVADCGHCQCTDSGSYGRHQPETMTETNKAGKVVRTWRECGRCHALGV